MIICCGEALIDMLPRHLPNGEDVYLPVPGGALLNTAISLGRLGEATGFVSGISNDIFGEQLIAHMAASDLTTEFCVRSDDPTTLAFVKLIEGQAQYCFFDENTAGRLINMDALPALPRTVSTLHFGGISLISEPCGSTYEAFMKRHHKSLVISFDPNIRTSFVHDEYAYRRRLDNMLGMSDIIKISDEDLAWLKPRQTFESAAHQWIETGASLVILTRGEKGARAITVRDDICVAACKVDIVDTVGAGDTFNAGLLATLRIAGALTKNTIGQITADQLRDAIEFASKVSAFTVAQSGANPPWRRDLS